MNRFSLRFSAVIVKMYDLLSLATILTAVQEKGYDITLYFLEMSEGELREALERYRVETTPHLRLKELDAECHVYPGEIFFTANAYMTDSVYTFLEERGGRIVYLPYASSISADSYSEYVQYNRCVHRKAWRIYVLNEFYVDVFRECNNESRGENVRVARTSAKFDRVLSSMTLCPLEAKAKRFLYNIHFEIVPRFNDTRTWSALPVYHAPLLQFFSKRKDLELIVRPHPVLFKEYGFDRLWDTFSRLDNVTMDDSRVNSYEESFNRSDALITDLSTLSIDYSVTGKPIILLEYEHSRRMHWFGRHFFDSFAYNVRTPEALWEILVKLSLGDDSMKEQRRALLSGGEWFDLSRPSAEIILDDISNDSLQPAEKKNECACVAAGCW